jgi:zinc/manganese transport system permease protein
MPAPARPSAFTIGRPLLYTLLIAPFAEFEFMRRALVGILAIAVGGVPTGIFLMLRRMSLAGDAMAHAVLPGAAIGYLVAGLSLPAMTAGGLVAGFVVAILSGLVTRFTALKEDASLATFYLLSLALGVTLVSLRGSNIDLLHVLFGSVLALDDATLLLLAAITSITLAVLAVIYRPLVIECVDPLFLRSVSGGAPATHLVFLGLVVLNLVAGFHALGTLLAVGIMMLPAAAARFWSADITIMTAFAVAIGLLSGIAGLLASFHAGLPAGPSVILAAGAAYILSLLFGSEGGLAGLAWRGRHLEA